MKKTFAISLASLLVLTMTACGSGKGSSSGKPEKSSTVSPETTEMLTTTADSQETEPENDAEQPTGSDDYVLDLNSDGIKCIFTASSDKWTTSEINSTVEHIIDHNSGELELDAIRILSWSEEELEENVKGQRDIMLANTQFFSNVSEVERLEYNGKTFFCYRYSLYGRSFAIYFIAGPNSDSGAVKFYFSSPSDVFENYSDEIDEILNSVRFS